MAAAILLGLKRWSGLSALLSTGSALLCLIFCIVLAGGGEAAVETKSYPWIDLGPDLEIAIGFQIDGLSRGMMLIVSSIGFLVHLFSLGYMKDDKGKSPLLRGALAFPLLDDRIVLADNFAMMFVLGNSSGSVPTSSSVTGMTKPRPRTRRESLPRQPHRRLRVHAGDPSRSGS